jgi:hypothetical protein
MTRKYETLTKVFWTGSLHGQVQSVWNTRNARPEKVEDFKLAVAAGDIVLDNAKLKPIDRRHLIELGIEPPPAEPEPEPEPPPDRPNAPPHAQSKRRCRVVDQAGNWLRRSGAAPDYSRSTNNCHCAVSPPR